MDSGAALRRGGRVHLVGAGGVGMAGLAFLLKARGCEVSGCDLRANRLTDWLRREGIEVALGHDPRHAERADWLVRSTAVPASHPELLRARERGLPVFRRGEVLPALLEGRTGIAVAGSHGKTTTVAMIAQVLDCGYFVGGEIADRPGVARDGDPLAVEADESDGTLAGYEPDFSAILNVDYDHMEHHASEAAFVGCFERLIERTRERVFYRADDPILRRLCEGRARCEPFRFPDPPLDLPLPGDHNQWNAAAARAVCRCRMDDAQIARRLARVAPVRRRFETISEAGGVRVVADYAHHPTEIAALVRAARSFRPRRLLALFQPHRHTRTRALGAAFPPAFEGVDELWIVPVYAASERPVEGGRSADLIRRFPAARRPHAAESPEAARREIEATARPGDWILVVGAGDVYERWQGANGGGAT